MEEINNLLSNMSLTSEFDYKHCEIKGWEYEREGEDYFFNLVGNVLDLEGEKICTTEDMFVQIHLQLDDEDKNTIYLDGFQHYESIEELGEGDYLRQLMQELTIRIKDTLKSYNIIETKIDK